MGTRIRRSGTHEFFGRSTHGLVEVFTGIPSFSQIAILYMAEGGQSLAVSSAERKRRVKWWMKLYQTMMVMTVVMAMTQSHSGPEETQTRRLIATTSSLEMKTDV
jgi:hypothetical protein